MSQGLTEGRPTAVVDTVTNTLVGLNGQSFTILTYENARTEGLIYVHPVYFDIGVIRVHKQRNVRD